MKSINARTSLRLALSFSWFIALVVVVRQVYGGEYYIYQNSNGQLVISNYAPPQGSSVIAKETLSEVTDQQITESRLRENQLALDNRLSRLERSMDELSENLHAEDRVANNGTQGYGDTNIAVGVAEQPTIVTVPARKKFNQWGDFKRSLPNARPRPVAPVARCCSGGKVW